MNVRHHKAGLAYHRTGVGSQLLLLHGMGSFGRAWEPVVGEFARVHDVIAVDLPGFGCSPPLREHAQIEDYVNALVAFLDALELNEVHVVGNSVGCWLALELAKRGRARSVTALSPVGLWRRPPWYVSVTFIGSWRLARALRPWSRLALSTRIGRAGFMLQAMGRPWRMPHDAAVSAVLNLVNSPGLRPMFDAAAASRFSGGTNLAIPITVAFGSRDPIMMSPRVRMRDELPQHVHWASLRGCGHVPMYDDPEQVVDLVLATTWAPDACIEGTPLHDARP